MLTIPAEVKALFQRDGVRKNFHVHFPNSDIADLNNENIVQESVVFTESLCSQEYFKFGCTEASQIEFTAVGIPNILGETMECAIEIDCSSLGSAWAEANPMDDSLPWLEPQTYLPGSYREQKKAVVVDIFTPARHKARINEITVPITYLQSGTGDPTPSNIRNFSAPNEVKIEVKSRASIYGPIKTTDLGQYVYEGVLDFNSGKLTITKVIANLWELTWTKKTFTNYGYSKSFFVSNGTSSDVLSPINKFFEPDIACNCYTPRCFDDVILESGNSADNSIIITTKDELETITGVSVGAVGIYDSSKSSGTAAAFKTYLESIDAQIIYTLKEPLVLQLSTQTWNELPTANDVYWDVWWLDSPLGEQAEITVDYSVMPRTGNLVYRIPYGRFTVDSCPRDHGAMYNRKVIGYTEDSLTGVQMIQGQFPVKTLTVNPIDWLKIRLGQIEIPTVKRCLYATPWWFVYIMGAASGRPAIWTLTGIYPASDGGRDSQSDFSDKAGYVQYLGRSKYYLQVDFEEHEYDQYASKFQAAALATLPSGDYKYMDGLQIFKDEATAISFISGQFAPCFFISVLYEDASQNQFYRYSKPVYIKPGETYSIDANGFTDISWANGVSVPSGYTLVEEEWAIELHVCVPMAWDNKARWEWENSSGEDKITKITGWSSCAPFLTPHVERPGIVDVKLVEADEVTLNIPEAHVNSTLKVSKGKLGNYYTYYNAISALGAINGAMELIGAFWKVARQGGSSVFNISENQEAIQVSRSQWESFWWDENDVDPIGQVNVQFTDDASGESWMHEFTIGEGESVHIMEENTVLKDGKASTADIQTALDTYFEPNASVVNFTPVDLTMKGLPYLEAGDKIQLEADDGSVVETYILEHRISGIQHLRAEVTSTNGSTLKVSEE